MARTKLAIAIASSSRRRVLLHGRDLLLPLIVCIFLPSFFF
jgi:hypothetical protein